MGSGKPITCKYCKGQFRFESDEVRYKWKESLYTCPICQIDYCILPPTERDLKKLQNEYVKSGRDIKYLNKMCRILYQYVPSLIKRHFSKAILKAVNSEGDDPMSYYTHKAIVYTIENFLKKDDYIIYSSFGKYLIDAIRWSIFEKKEHQSKDLSIDFVMEDGHNVQYEDTKMSIIDNIELQEYRKNIVTTMMSFVKEMRGFCTQREYFVFLLMLNNYLCKGEKFVDKFFETYEDKTGKLKYMEFLELLKKEIKNLYIE